MSAVLLRLCIGTAWAPRTSRAAFPVTSSAFAIACPQQSSRERAGLLLFSGKLRGRVLRSWGA